MVKNGKSNPSHDKDLELAAFRSWVDELSVEELVRAMEFDFISEDNSGLGSAGCNSSHEFDLLEQMINHQPPPPTPIHPRALSFRPATHLGATDGRSETQRRRHDRFCKPRLFQFLQRESVNCHPRRKQQQSGRRIIRGSSKTNHSEVPNKRYDVIFRKFVTSSGDILSIGCTCDQKEADRAILERTGIKYGSAYNNSKHCCFLIDGKSSCGSSKNKWHDVIYIRRILHIASRGRFLSTSYVGSSASSFLAPWFDPCSQWFSLPMYMASRYEVAIWKSYRVHLRRKGQHKQKISTNSPSTTAPVRTIFESATEKLSSERIIHAIQKALKQTLVNNIIPKDPTVISKIRDSIIWSFFEAEGNSELQPNVLAVSKSHSSILLSVTTIPLLDVGSIKDSFRLSLQSILHDTLTHEVQIDLFDELSNEGTGAAASASVTRTKSRKKKGKKRKKKVQRNAQLPALMEENNTYQEVGVVRKDGENNHDNNSNDGVVSEELEKRYLATMSTTSASKDRPIPSLKDHNRNKVAILKALEDIIDEVQNRIGEGQNVVVEEEEERFQWNVVGEKKRTHESNNNLRSKESTLEPSLSSRPVESKESDGHLDESNNKNESPLQSLPSPQSNHDAVHSFIKPNMAESPDPYDLPYREHNPVFAVSSGLTAFNLNENTYHEWERMRKYQNRDKSLLAEFFIQKEKSEENQDDFLMASSTAASIASSSGIESGIDGEDSDEVEDIVDEDSDEVEEGGYLSPDDQFIPVDDLVDQIAPDINLTNNKVVVSEIDDEKEKEIQGEMLDKSHDKCPSPASAATELTSLKASATGSPPIIQKETTPPCSPEQTPFPPEPATPPPQLSPILVSLGDLPKLRTTGVAGSLPGSPVLPSSNRLAPSWSREDLRVGASTDDHQARSRTRSFHRSVESLSSKGSAGLKLKKELKKGHLNQPFVPDLGCSGNEVKKVIHHKESCAFSETAADGHREGQQWAEPTKFNDDTVDVPAPRDGSTTLSGLSPQENEEVSTIREERNSFRDMCLTLGAEVSMLKNLLAAEKANKTYSSADYSQEYGQQMYGLPYNPEFMQSHFHGIPRGITSSRTIGAMSDAGIHRADQDASTTVSMSEDGTDIVVGPHETSGHRQGHVRRLSSNATAHSIHDHGSDASFSGSIDYRNFSRDTIGTNVPSHQSRLTKDILSFVNSMNIQLRKQSARRRLATERLSRLLSALWPRAQVKMYGSHVSGSCLPSSDLDFVVCLPAVHKNNPVVTPGDLEGRNAINEPYQKLLARKLKGESWIDPTSIKLIDRTTVPVIKLSTKDTRAHTLQLDISFDSPEHHGLEAVGFVKRIMQELPMIRPLLLVLKQFLLDRALLTAYTGGLSSYCLFLMIARYLQEHGSSWGDCGSLLMGFLDFYGNRFDPRVTGISVRRRQYFPRTLHNGTTGIPHHLPSYPQQEQQVWNMNNPPHHQQQHHMLSTNPSTELVRRHSHSEKVKPVGGAGTTTKAAMTNNTQHGMRPSSGYHPVSSTSPNRFIPQFVQGHHGVRPYRYNNVSKPYTFDPLFVEDPLSAGNNVGRNAFRIFQVQRSFSDAHRALVASLEWDMYSASELNDGFGDYPLLKCLLQSEDVFYEFDDNR